MFKDKFILGLVIATLIIFGGGVWFASKLINPTASPDGSSASEEKTALLEISDMDHSQGNTNASVTLIQYLDFECEVCGSYYPLVKQLVEEFGTEVQFVNRYFPLQGHRNAMNAALAVEAAHKQGKYFEMHDLLFEKQEEWGGKEFAQLSIFEEYAKEIGLNLEQFQKDVVSEEVRDRVNQDLSSGRQLGVNSTPTFFLYNEKIPNPRSLEDFKTLIKAALLKAPKPEELVLGEKVHEHIDLKIYLNGKQLDLTQSKYQSTDEKELNANTHLHDGNGNIVHKHRDGVTIGYFLDSLKIKLSKDCLVLDTGEKYCNDNTNELKFLINGQRSELFTEYEINDLDRVLISFGPKDENLETQIKSVTDEACKYSEKCPERGPAPTENCVGGLGTDC